MPETTYNYDSAADFHGGLVNTSQLAVEIAASSIVTALSRIDTAGGSSSAGVSQGCSVAIVFKDALSGGDETVLDGLVAAHRAVATASIPTVQLVDASLKTAPLFRQGPRPVIPQFLDCTFNWCDPRSWYSKARQRIGVTLTKNVANLDRGEYFLNDGEGNPVPYWIDTLNFRVYRGYEHLELTAVIYLNGVEQTVAPAGKTTDDGFDVQIDFTTGIVLFALGEGLTGEVTADFFHVDPDLTPQEQSTFIMNLQPGKSVLVEKVEVQFTQGVDIRDTAIFAAFAPLNYIMEQADNTLDPLALAQSQGYSAIPSGMAFLISDKDNLHANFGSIPGLGNGDIVIWTVNIRNKSDQFRIWFDASKGAVGTKAMLYLLGTSPFPTVREWNGSSWDAPGYGAPTKVEVPNTRDLYPTFESYLNDATGNYSPIPAGFSSNASGRGCDHAIMQIPLNWLGAKEINALLGVELRVWLENGIPFGPNSSHFATATFYGTVADL